MKCFRIGRKPPGPWPNMTPPIRGGVYRKEESLLDSKVECVSGEIPEMGDLEKMVEAEGIRRRTPPISEPVGEKGTGDAASSPGYTDVAMQEEVDNDLRDYPSLEEEVQQQIIHKYRALHQKVRDQGLYDCPYLEYGKEVFRYGLLFAGFLTALSYEWYMTSAVLLGLFWVGSLVSHTPGRHN